MVSLVSVTMMALASLSLASVSNAADWFDGLPTVTTDKDVYLAGQTVGISVTCYVPASFSSTGQCYFTVEDALGNTVYDRRNHVSVFWVLTSLMPPKTFSFEWNQLDDAGKQVQPGDYEIWGYEAGYRFWGPPLIGNSTSVSIVERYDVNLPRGWNLFSLPLLASNYTSSSLGLPNGSVVAGWNKTTSSYDLFIVGLSPPSRAFALTDFSAYFIYTPSSCTVSIFGLPVTSPQTFQWNLSPSGSGWVFAGFPKTGTVHYANEIQSWIDTPGAKVMMVVRFNPATGSYQTWFSSLPMINNFPLWPGEGYGIFLTTSSLYGNVVTVTYGP